MKKLIPLLCLMMIGCAMPKKHILSAGLVSMTERGRAPTHVKEVGKIEASYCQGDDAITSHDGGIGLIDEVVQRAQRDSQVNYIRNAQFYAQGACLSMEGIGLREETKKTAKE